MKKFNTLLFAFIIVGIFSCVTTKKKDAELSTLKKLYHNTTAQYNGYFNADILLQKSIAGLNQDYQDNYNKVLEIFPYVASDKAKSVAGDLDKAIEKVSVDISLHRQSDWVDDCYLLMGQAQFVKQDYETAEETLEFMVDHFNPENPQNWKSNKKKKKTKKERKKEKKAKKKDRNKKKKEKEKERKKKKKDREDKIKESKKKAKKAKKDRKRNKKKKGKKKASKKEDKIQVPTNVTPKEKDAEKEEKKEDKKPPKTNDGDLLHKRPMFQDGQLWLAKTYIAREKYDLAENILTNLDNNPKTFKDVRKELAPTFAYFYLTQKNYTGAISQLEKAIELERKKNKKARYAFTIAQLYQLENNNEQAVAYFNKSKKYSNDYEMEFSAQLNILEAGYKTGKYSNEVAVKKLKKLLRDAKNIEYKDKIYFSLAEVALASNETDSAIDYYKKSIVANVDNIPQRTESCYRLAHLLYNAENYVDSKLYFDSTKIVMTKMDDRFTEVSNYADNLKEIAENLEIVQLQDSLLMVSTMTDDQKKDLVKKLKKEEEKNKALAKATGNNKKGNPSARNQASRGLASANGGISRRPSSSTTPSSFFAYNPRALKRGKKDFKKIWGDRKLEDDWRLKSKQTNSIDEDLTTTDESEIEEKVTDDDMKRLLKGVPYSDAEKIKSQENIQDALMALGRLFRERLDKNEKTVEVLEGKLLKEYPQTKHELDAWYYLYLAHTDLNNRAKAKEYYDKIVDKYPETTYARVLSDPNFLDDAKKAANKLEDFYNLTYQLIQSSEYKKAYEKVKISDKLFGNENSYRGKFALLGAMSIGNMKGKDAYITELKDVIVKFPKSPVEKRAKEILRLLGDKSIKAPTANNSKTKFTYAEKKVQYIIIPIEDQGDAKLSDIKGEVARFNRKYYKSKKLRISTIYLGTDTDHPIIIIRKFKTSKDGMKYYNDAKDDEVTFIPKGVQYKIFVVTQNSYRQILRDKSLGGYESFFNEKYLNK